MEKSSENEVGAEWNCIINVRLLSFCLKALGVAHDPSAGIAADTLMLSPIL